MHVLQATSTMYSTRTRIWIIRLGNYNERSRERFGVDYKSRLKSRMRSGISGISAIRSVDTDWTGADLIGAVLGRVVVLASGIRAVVEVGLEVVVGRWAVGAKREVLAIWRIVGCVPSGRGRGVDRMADEGVKREEPAGRPVAVEAEVGICLEVILIPMGLEAGTS
jgi:hypothetical protein